MTKYYLSNLDNLESESIHIIREVVAEAENPVMLYSVGKDSSVMLRLAQKAFSPGKVPFPLLHVDTGMKFKGMYDFRDKLAEQLGFKLIIYRNEKAIGNGVNPFDYGTQKCCAQLKTQALLDALKEGGYDVAFGGARRDEEKSRAKERIFSFRDKFGQWDPKNQRPELWDIYNSKHNKGESIRVFPISNWTELDVWTYIHRENIPIVPMYYAEHRDMIIREGQLIPISESEPGRLEENEEIQKIMCRFRTLGCYPCTGAIPSNAQNLEEIIEEIMVAKNSERITRVIDHDAEGSMELKKREGYF